jgi:MYXO-CTERM domain-containing protein
MKNINTILAVGAVTAVCGAAEAAIVAAWDFQTTTNGGTALVAAPNTPKVLAANFGSGTIYLDGTNGSSNFASVASNPQLTAFSGTAVNANTSIGMATSTSVGALGIANSSSNGSKMVFAFNMSSLANLSFTFAAQRTSTGFTGIVIETSTDGSSWNAWTTLTSTSAGSPLVYSGPIKDSFANSGVISVASTATLDNATTAYVRFTFSGASSASGNNRLDNFIFSADAVPAPGAMALLGVAGLLGARRRR